MKRKHKGLITSIILIVVASSLLFGCNSKEIKKNMESGVNNLNCRHYKEALENFNNVLKLDKENKEAESLKAIINNYEEAKKNFEENNLSKANELIEEIPSKYNNYKIKDDIEKLKDEIKIKEDNIKNINNNLNLISNLLDNNKLYEVKDKINNIKMQDATKEQKEKLDKLKITFNKKIEEEKKKLEEQKKKEEKLKQEEKKAKEEKAKNNNIVNSNENRKKIDSINTEKTSSSNIHYVNKELGIQMELPGDWKGHYEVYEYNEGKLKGVNFEFVSDGKNTRQPLYCIARRLKNNTLDSIRYKTINGVDYAMGYAPVMFLDTSNGKAYNEFKKLYKEADLIYSTIRGL